MDRTATHDVALGLLRLARELVADGGTDPVVDPAAERSCFEIDVCLNGLADFRKDVDKDMQSVTFYFEKDYPGLEDDDPRRSRIEFGRKGDGSWSYEAFAGGEKIASNVSNSCESCWSNLLRTLHSSIVRKMCECVDAMRTENGDMGQVGTCHLSDDPESGRCTAVFIGDPEVKSEAVSNATHEVFRRLVGIGVRDEARNEYGKNVISFELKDKQQAKRVIGQCGFGLTGDLDNNRG